MTTVLVAGLALTSSGPAWADPPGGSPSGVDVTGAAALPEGWALTAEGKRPVLTWRAPAKVPMGDAAVEFYADGRPLGRPRATADQRSFRLDITGTRPGDLSELQVRAGGRRLDAAGAAQRSRTPFAPVAPATAAALPKNPVDPGTKGKYPTVTGEYTLPGVKLPDFPEKVEMQGVVVAPKGATGKRPLALFLHGRHYTCFAGADEDKISGDWPCPAGTKPIPSHRGYLQAQRLLASQGYVTVSISANGINGQDWAADDGGAQARSSLVRQHLAKWADWAGTQRPTAPAIVKSAPIADLSKVLLMGHSRGGEGVNRAATDSHNVPPVAQDGYRGKVRWTIRGTVLIGPTIFGHNPAPDMPSVTILPGCDGDVSDLQGQIFVDGTRGVSRGAALHSAVFVVGANHNFFNTEWTPGQAVAPAFDDFGSDKADTVCTPGKAKTRLTARQQQTVGATYIAAAAHLFVAGNDKVRPLLDGSGVRAASAGPARVLSHAVGANRRTLVVPGSSTKVTGTGAALCTQVAQSVKRACINPNSYRERSPHFVPFLHPEPDRYAVALKWSTAKKTVTVKPSKATSITGATALALRIIVPANSTGTRFDVAVTDTKGHRGKLGTVRIDGLPGSGGATSYWGQEVRVPLTAARRAKVDLRKVAKLQLVPRTRKGKAWLIDAWGWRTGTPAPKAVALPRVDVGRVTVDEGDAGTRTYQVPVKVSGKGTGQVRLFYTDPKTYRTTATVATVKSSTRSIKVPITVTGNTRYGDSLWHALQIKAIKGTVIGQYTGGALVRDDDPMPTVTVEPVADKVTEGASLTWRVKLSAVADGWIYVGLPVQAPAGGGPELSTTDVDPEWLRDWTGEEPLPSRPLSSTHIGLFADIAAGKLSADVTLPTIKDTVAEPTEYVQLQAMIFPPDFGDPAPGAVVTRTVVDAP